MQSRKIVVTIQVDAVHSTDTHAQIADVVRSVLADSSCGDETDSFRNPVLVNCFEVEGISSYSFSVEGKPVNHARS